MSLNRAQRRKMAKQGVTAQDIKQIQSQTKDYTLNHAISCYSLATMMVLRDKWGFGEKRLLRYLEEVQNMFNAINEDYVKFEDLAKTLEEECNIIIERSK